MPGRGGGTGAARTALLTSLVVLSCTVAFVGGLSPAPKSLVSSALAPPSRHAHHLDVHASDAPWPNDTRPNAPRPNAPAGRTPGDDPTQDPSTSASCAGLGHAPSFVTTAIVGGFALRHEPTTITVVLAPHAGRQEASIIRSISVLTGSSPEGKAPWFSLR